MAQPNTAAPAGRLGAPIAAPRFPAPSLQALVACLWKQRSEREAEERARTRLSGFVAQPCCAASLRYLHCAACSRAAGSYKMRARWTLGPGALPARLEETCRNLVMERAVLNE